MARAHEKFNVDNMRVWHLYPLSVAYLSPYHGARRAARRSRDFSTDHLDHPRTLSSTSFSLHLDFRHRSSALIRKLLPSFHCLLVRSHPPLCPVSPPLSLTGLILEVHLQGGTVPRISHRAVQRKQELYQAVILCCASWRMEFVSHLDSDTRTSTGPLPSPLIQGHDACN